ncbi:hypothetical protein Fmac_004545 [Flemingia macrophylla]|uniref:FAS1 domain-containing protein n=1 Tax=Flemingia macrophylla TaxID=520843 RepID=A0ABD1N584_9FABA
MVGVYGSSNIRRCNVLKLITRRVERDGLFDVVVMTSVLRKKTWWWRWIKSPDVKRIQEELGNELGVQFHDKTRMEERASSLAERIKMEEKILIVTNVFCGGINFEKIGIPYGNDHKGCKIMLVAKSIEMLSNKMHPKGYLSSDWYGDCCRRVYVGGDLRPAGEFNSSASLSVVTWSSGYYVMAYDRFSGTITTRRNLAHNTSLVNQTGPITAQSPAAAPKAPAKPTPAKPAPTTPAPAPAKPLVPALPNSPLSGPDSSGSQDIVKILRKAKSFNTLIRLLKTTQIINQVNAQLVTSKNGGLTILAPDDGAFSELKAGYFNSLGDRQQKALIQFHVLPVYVSSSNFDALSNPVLTLASDSPTGYQLNVTAYGNSVNISTGVVNATLTGIVYTDKTLAIYHVDKVLIPLDFSKPKPIAPAPALAKAPKADKDNSSAEDDDQAQASKDSSGATSLVSTHATTLVSFGVALLAAAATVSSG